ncbi:MAG: Uma2 family endonuclease [Thiolinea sp.]
MPTAKLQDLPRYTYDDYCQWEGDWELIEGVPYAMAPAPAKIHQMLSLQIASQLDDGVEECPDCEVLQDTDWKIDSETTVRPDVAVVCSDQNPKYISKTPEIAFEIISPSTASKDENLKLRLYADEGVKYYVLVYPDELLAKIFQLHPDGERYRKVAECDSENYIFEEARCPVSVDFARVFRRFR